MKDIIEQMDRAFESRVRIGIMTMLLLQEWVDFSALRDTMGVTDGNLASHTTLLEERNYLEVRKQFIGKRPNTAYRATTPGKQAFIRYVNAFKELMQLKIESLQEVRSAREITVTS